ncbi:ROK family protein [Metabacillus sp. KIGAM252]|uniref:ROK family protein n=2 Tax=Metabacillus flavus TaxID=2823519 RepID=A0ABS5LH60_9BACI|nr:ROK family protein [Metabacillus flavus]MBS2970078.1 ROK family protein [Metabacillus flavus]
MELGSATKAELSRKLDISFPTISKFLTQMEKDGELLTMGFDDSSGGRRARRYVYNPEYMLGLSVILEKSETHYTVFTCLGEVKEHRMLESVLMKDLDLLTGQMEKILQSYPNIRSIAIGVPGSVKDGCVFFIPDYELFDQFHVKEYFEDRFSIPVAVENDMNAAVLGYYKNKGVADESLVYMYSGKNGPGAGILINGAVIRGSTFFSGEVSFVPLYDDRNFLQALQNGAGFRNPDSSKGIEYDAISRMAASFTAMINPRFIIFSQEEVDEAAIKEIELRSAHYIPAEHLPKLVISDWKRDYLYGLQSLGLDLMITCQVNEGK